MLLFLSIKRCLLVFISLSIFLITSVNTASIHDNIIANLEPHKDMIGEICLTLETGRGGGAEATGGGKEGMGRREEET